MSRMPVRAMAFRSIPVISPLTTVSVILLIWLGPIMVSTAPPAARIREITITLRSFRQ